jgi:hypothetical protein
VLGYLALPFRLSLLAEREVASGYESVLGAAFLVAAVLVALALWWRRLDAMAGIAAVVAVALFVWWAAAAQVLRYLVPALVPAAIASVCAAAGIWRSARRAGPAATADPDAPHDHDAPATRSDGWARGALLVPAGASLLVLLSWFAADAPFLSVLGAESRTDYLSRRLAYYPYYRTINERLPRDARVWLIDVRRDTYHLARDYRGDYLFEDYTLRHWIEEGLGVSELRQRARDLGITHVFIRHDVLLDPRRSPLVDDRIPAARNAARLATLRDFLVQGTDVLGSDQTYLLVALPKD